MNRQILKPQVDVPLVVLLDKGPEGKETTSQRGDLQFQYTVNDDSCVMWLPPEARAAIMRSGAQAGDTVQLVKSLRGKNAFWNAQVLPDAAEPPPPPPANTRLVAPRPAYAYQPNNENDEFAKVDPRYSQPNGRAQAGAARLNPPPTAAATQADGLNTAAGKRCFQAAIDVLAAARHYAQETYHWDLEVNAEDVRALGISFLIGERNGGAR
jgi:hypothetical protein